MSEEVFWSESGKRGKEYTVTTWYRAPGLGDFLVKVGMKNIVGVILKPSVEEKENIIGFILKEGKRRERTG